MVYPAEGLEKDMERKTEEWYLRGMDKSKYPNIIWRNRNSVESPSHIFLFLETVERNVFHRLPETKEEVWI